MTKVLLIAYENDARCLFEASQKLKKQGFDVLIIEGAVSTATRFYQLPIDSYVGINSVISNFNKQLRSQSLPSNPWLELQKIEQNMLDKRKNMRQLIRTAPYYHDDHHTRKPFYRIGSEYLRCCYVLELSKWYIEIVNDFQPDIVFCLQGNYFIKQLAASLADNFDYSYFVLVRSRIGNYFTLLDAKYNPVFLSPNTNAQATSRASSSFPDHELPKGKALTYDGFHEAVSARQKTIPILSIISTLIGLVKSFFEVIFIRFYTRTKSIMLGGKERLYYFNGSMFLDLLYSSKNAINSILLSLSYSNIFETIVDTKSRSSDSGKYILYFLHVLPESSTLSMSNNYYEEDLIRHLSSLLPINCTLLVKENVQMIGERNLSFYRRFSDLGNVVFVDPCCPTDLLFEIGSAAVGVTGTFLLEALSCGYQYCAAYGLPEFLDLLPQGYQGYSGVERMMSDFSDNISPPQSKVTLSQYISSLQSLDIKWDFSQSKYAHHGYNIDDSRRLRVSSDIVRAINLAIDAIPKEAGK